MAADTTPPNGSIMVVGLSAQEIADVPGRNAILASKLAAYYEPAIRFVLVDPPADKPHLRGWWAVK